MLALEFPHDQHHHHHIAAILAQATEDKLWKRTSIPRHIACCVEPRLLLLSTVTLSVEEALHSALWTPHGWAGRGTGDNYPRRFATHLHRLSSWMSKCESLPNQQQSWCGFATSEGRRPRSPARPAQDERTARFLWNVPCDHEECQELGI